jgi:NAD(P) transhydrogenase subunit alpha
MRLAVPKEVVPGEKRVALVPEVIPQLVKLGHTVAVQAGAGTAAGFTDDAYRAAGASVVPDAASVYSGAQMILKVQRPDTNGSNELASLDRDAILIGLLQPAGDPTIFAHLAEANITSMSMELVPRTTRAQMMDALSSQSTVAGYKAVLLAANALQKFFPMLMTAAGTVRPARVLVIGAGVAGLQAIATARRIGAVVEAFDTRPVVKEQVQSLGATFIDLNLGQHDAQDSGGYAKELAEEHIRKEKEAIHEHAKNADVVITTALVPGRRAPLLLNADTVEAMKPGSVIVDLAGEQGGNCELTSPGETVVVHGVTIIAPTNIASDLAYHSSQMYAKNVAALIALLTKEGNINLDMNDDIIAAVTVTSGGAVVNQNIKSRLNGATS